MNNFKNFIKLAAVIAITFALIFLAPSCLKAQNVNTSAEPLTVTVSKSMIIPKVVVPDSGSATLEITTGNAIGPATNVERLSADQQAAEILVTSTSDSVNTINITTTSLPVGVTVSSYSVNWDGKLVTTGLPFTQEIKKNKNYIMRIGINLSINNTVSEGPIKIGFRVDIN
jgi:hypothetical protein